MNGKPGEISGSDSGEVAGSLSECPVCHSTLPEYTPQGGGKLECDICYADLEVAPDLSRLIFKKFGGQELGKM